MRKIAEKTDIGNIFWRWKNSPPHGHFSFCNIGVHMLWTDFGNTLNSKKWTKRIHKWKKIDKKQVSKVYGSIRSRQNFLCRNNFQQKSFEKTGRKKPTFWQNLDTAMFAMLCNVQLHFPMINPHKSRPNDWPHLYGGVDWIDSGSNKLGIKTKLGINLQKICHKNC